MSVVPRVGFFVICDHPGHDLKKLPETWFYESPESVRAAMPETGWTTASEGDFCPRCPKEAQR